MAPEPCAAPDQRAELTLQARAAGLHATLLSVVAAAPRLKEAELRLALALATLADEHLTVKASSRELAAVTGLARSKVVAAIHSLNQRGLITTRQGTATRPSAYHLNLAAVVQIRGPLPGPLTAPRCSPNGTTPLPFGDQGDPPKGPPLTENTELADAPSTVDRSSDSILDRVLTAKKGHHDKRDLAELRQWVDGYWAKLGPAQPNPHPVDDTILAQMLAVAPLAQLVNLLKTLFSEHKRPEFSPAWFVVVALQRIHGIRPEALKARRTELRAVRKPAPPQPQQEGLAFAAGLTAELVSKVRGL